MEENKEISRKYKIVEYNNTGGKTGEQVFKQCQ